MPNGLLLAVHCKRGEPAPLKEAVLEYISATYGRRAGGASMGGAGRGYLSA